MKATADLGCAGLSPGTHQAPHGLIGWRRIGSSWNGGDDGKVFVSAAAAAGHQPENNCSRIHAEFAIQQQRHHVEEMASLRTSISAILNCSEGVVDVRQVGKPDTLMSNREQIFPHWPDWVFTFTALFSSQCPCGTAVFGLGSQPGQDHHRWR